MGSKQRRQLARARNQIVELERAAREVLGQYELLLDANKDLWVREQRLTDHNKSLQRQLRQALIIGWVEGLEELKEPHRMTIDLRQWPRTVSIESLEPLVSACVGRSIEELVRRAGQAQESPREDAQRPIVPWRRIIPDDIGRPARTIERPPGP